MLTLIVVFIGSCFYVLKYYPSLMGGFERVLTALLVSIIPVCTAGAFTTIAGEVLDHTYTTQEEISIYPWHDDGGERYLSINKGRNTYYLSLQRENGSLDYVMLTQDSFILVEVIEEERSDGLIEVQDRYVTNPVMRVLATNIVYKRYIIHIPKGTLAP